MSFIQDPRLRQRWNRISHNAEAVTENAAAGIWSFQHNYIGPCFAGLAGSIDSCTSLCLGDREERARRIREREWGARRARPEYMFDFYDDWDDIAAADEAGASGSGGLLGGWSGPRGEDWDRLLAGTGGARSRQSGGGGSGVDVTEQPRRKRGMSYGTRGTRRKSSEVEDPTIIPSTAPLGFLERLPFRIRGTLRYKPSAANLRDNIGTAPLGHEGEHQPLLGFDESDDASHEPMPPKSRSRSGTAGSGDTSSSYRSRGDLFPSDGEGDEDAVPLDDEFDVALERVDDRSSNKTRSSKGKAPSGKNLSRTVSRTTMSSSIHSQNSRVFNTSVDPVVEPEEVATPSLEELHHEEAIAAQEEHEENERKRKAAAQLALDRGLQTETWTEADVETKEELDPPAEQDLRPAPFNPDKPVGNEGQPVMEAKTISRRAANKFVPARLPHFG